MGKLINANHLILGNDFNKNQLIIGNIKPARNPKSSGEYFELG
jgi:hypothetical protein